MNTTSFEWVVEEHACSALTRGVCIVCDVLLSPTVCVKGVIAEHIHVALTSDVRIACSVLH